MIPEIVYSKYSQAMFDIASEQNKLEEFGNELKAVRDILQGNPDSWKFLNHPLIPPKAKKEILKEIFSDSVSPLVLRFLYVMVDRRREAAMVCAIDGFIDLARKAQHIAVAKIRVVKPLSAQEEKKLLASLEQMTGQKIDPLYYTDPTIIGGVVVQIGDRLIDGSLLRQLRDMKHALLKADVMNGVTDE
ncbi:MAG: ATP synthase F1 subunit delta [Megasphaera sp.]|jgi:F-type H+-transporting ATPase subunit delta|nr:ATP synthase F1 subunit delta [Megasphaera sp.]MCH4187464.1 ATP synthase F1 subunit delta [Megasphaera sp.]MCH4217383.1 ATP synthase F1 subunit delta [Megasphaera sp.]